jgi:hypothetical protein
MSHVYDPIIRNFCRVRATFTSSLGIERRAVRPRTLLDTLLPIDVRRLVWRQLKRHLPVPGLELSDRERERSLWIVLIATLAFTLCLQNWFALIVAVPVSLFVHRASCPRAIHFPYGLRTVGELVICATQFGDHKESGYRWTRNEIALKVRITIADAVGVPVEELRPETKFLKV